MESMDVLSRRWMCVESMGVCNGCGCKEVYGFSHITYPYSSCIYSFLQQHPYFLFIFLNCFLYDLKVLVHHLQIFRLLL